MAARDELGRGVKAGRPCPRDGAPLERRTVGPAEVHLCPGCKGLWIGSQDLESFLRSPFESWKLHSMEGSGSTSAVAHAPVPCLCDAGVEMDTVTRDGVIVDVCPACRSLWLDGGELEALLQRAGSGGRGGGKEGVDMLSFLGDVLEVVFQLVGP